MLSLEDKELGRVSHHIYLNQVYHFLTDFLSNHLK